METYIVLQRSKGGYAEVVVYDFGGGLKLSIVERLPRRKWDRVYYKGTLFRGAEWEKVWEITTMRKDVIVGAAKNAIETLGLERAQTVGKSV